MFFVAVVLSGIDVLYSTFKETDFEERLREFLSQLQVRNVTLGPSDPFSIQFLNHVRLIWFI